MKLGKLEPVVLGTEDGLVAGLKVVGLELTGAVEGSVLAGTAVTGFAVATGLKDAGEFEGFGEGLKLGFIVGGGEGLKLGFIVGGGGSGEG